MNAAIGLVFSFIMSINSPTTRPVPEDSSQKLIEIKVEPQGNLIHNVSLELDDEGKILRFVRQSSQSTQVIDANAVLQGEVVIARASDKDAVLVSCKGCSLETGGTLVLKYLDNGISNVYKTKNYNLTSASGEWELFAGSTYVHNLTMISRTLFGQVIGIKEVNVNSY